MTIRAAALVFCPFALVAGSITVDYPQRGTIFPSDIAPPTFLWRDAEPRAAVWVLDAGGGVRITSKGEPFRFGPIDTRAVSETNEVPKPTPDQAAMHTCTPDAATWARIKQRFSGRSLTLTITGYPAVELRKAVSRGSVTFQVSKDPVGAPIFYRDVPLMPSELEKGVIKPLAAAAVPLIAWRLRNVGESQSRLLMEGLHTCANCHSFSNDGKTMGMDLDGPQNDKGLYSIVSVQSHTTVRNEDVVKWSSFRSHLGPDLRVGFMSQVSPKGDYVVTMVDRPGSDSRGRAGRGRGHFYVANFKDYRFLQVFYPTRGILAWYSRATGRLQPLPGADDPNYVHTNAVWTPDGKYLVFARARARDPYPEGHGLAERANDPEETPIQYDLYRIPFNEGRGGVAEPVAGASSNGMSNTFPKVSPDGRWIVFVKCRNGQLMRPDSELYIVPIGGGEARRMTANTPRMNSWHSFSPNGKWLVFSSKSRSPYTEMFLTHLDANGNDSPPVLVENATAANRAVNIPEFVNITPDGLMKMDAPAVESYRLFDEAFKLAEKGQHEAAIEAWRNVLKVGGDDSKVYMNLAVSIAATGKLDKAIPTYEKALALDSEDAEIRLNYGVALAGAGRIDDAIVQYRNALEIDPEYPEVHNNLGLALASENKLDEAVTHYRRALEINPRHAPVHNNLAVALARQRDLNGAVTEFQKFLEIEPDSVQVHGNLLRALAQAGRPSDAVRMFEALLAQHPNSAALHNTLGVTLVWQSKRSEAIAHFKRAIEIDPNMNEARQNLADAESQQN